MQTIWDEVNKIKCLFFCGIVITVKEAGTKSTSGDQLREKIQKWLSSPDPSINHNTACDAHQNGTATWFLEGTIYDEWKATGSLLWTHGNRMIFYLFRPHVADIISGSIAGSGKSILW